jgi:3',5'-cyclic AMP phosphodiesterase CpdA
MMAARILLLCLSLVCGLVLGACRDAVTEARETPNVVEEVTTRDIPPDALTLPNEELSIKFAVIGDSGRGTPEQHAIAAQMDAYRKRFDYRFVLMGGDNIYEGPATPEDYRLKFEEPYKPLLEAGVRFYAVLGNHDDPAQIHYPPFHMEGHRYYTFTPPVGVLSKLDTRVRFFALDSTRLDGEQLRWLQRELEHSNAEWKIALMHYPLYSSGRYTLRARRQRFMLEPALVWGGVDVTFSGHEHIYQRSRLQNGVLHFISGGAGSLRVGDARPSAKVAKSYDRDYHFLLVEVADEQLFFQAINRKGETVDAGSLRRPKPQKEASAPTADTAPRR